MRILLATDFKPAAGQALELAVLLAVGLPAELVLLHAVPWGSAEDPTDSCRSAELQLKEMHQELTGRAPVSPALIIRLTAADKLVLSSAQDVGADLIVMGAANEPGELGPVASSVLTQASRPLLLVPALFSELHLVVGVEGHETNELAFSGRVAEVLSAELQLVPQGQDRVQVANENGPALIALSGRRAPLARVDACRRVMREAPDSGVLLLAGLHPGAPSGPTAALSS